MFKRLSSLILMFFLSQVALGNDEVNKSVEYSIEVRDLHADFFSAMNGVNGTGVILCEKKTGIASPNAREPVGCIEVLFDNRDDFDSASKLFKTPFKLNDVWVTHFRFSSHVKEPSVSVRN